MFHARDIVRDLIKFSTVFIVARFISGKSLTDIDWMFRIVCMLIGFTAYHFFVRDLIPNKYNDGDGKKLAVDDALKFGTRFIVAQLIYGGSLFDPTWFLSSISVIIGFTIYHLNIKKVHSKKLDGIDKKLVGAINDLAKVGTMLIVSQLLSKSLNHSASAGILFGFTVYNLVTIRIMDMW
jgi:hypothetical protein